MALRNYKAIKTYDDAKNFFENNNNKLIANNTYLLKAGDNYIIAYHGNEIIRYNKDGSIQLFTQGWYSSTTKERLNLFTPNCVDVYQRKGEWFVHVTMLEKVEFYEGITIN